MRVNRSFIVPLLSESERSAFLTRCAGLSAEDYDWIETTSYALLKIVASLEQENCLFQNEAG